MQVNTGTLRILASDWNRKGLLQCKARYPVIQANVRPPVMAALLLATIAAELFDTIAAPLSPTIAAPLSPTTLRAFWAAAAS